MGIAAQSPSYRVIHLRCSYASTTLCTILLRSVRSCYALYDLTTISALPRRLCYLGIVVLDVSAMLPLCSRRSGHLQARCSPEVGAIVLDSRTNSVEDHVSVPFSYN